MKFIFILIVLTGFSIQNSYTQSLMSDLKGQQRYIYSDVANVRTFPGLDSEIADKVNAGQEVNIEDVGGALEVDGVSGFWLHITYKKSGKDKEGFLWSATLSQTQLRRGDTKFVYGRERIEEKYDEESDYSIIDGVLCIKAIRNDSILSKKKFTVSHYNHMTFTDGQIVSGEGLLNAEYIVKINVGGESCGIATHSFYYIWNGKELLDLPKTMYVGDAGAYYLIENLVFPTNQLLPENTIIKYQEEMQCIEEEDFKETYKYKVTLYKWNGKEAIQQKID